MRLSATVTEIMITAMVRKIILNTRPLIPFSWQKVEHKNIAVNVKVVFHF